jgi:hypothetical protein
MQLEFIPVEEFYFALTLAVRTLEEITQPGITDQIHQRLVQECGEPSTVAAASQNTFNYVFRVNNYHDTLERPIIISIADWQGKLRLSSDYGWMLDPSRKPIKTELYAHRPEFAKQLRSHLQNWLQVPLSEASSHWVA